MGTISGISGSGDAWAAMQAQRSQMQARMFAKVDADGSGGVDKAELQGLVEGVAQKTGTSTKGDIDTLFGQMDADADGALSQDELAQGLKDILPPPSTMEFAQSRAGSDAADDLFAKVDTDGDGKVSTTEMQSLVDKMASDQGSNEAPSGSEMVARLDSDGDGGLSQAEFEAGRPQGGEAPPGAGGGMPAPPAGGAAGAGGASASATYDPLDTNEDGEVSALERMVGSAKASTDPVQALIKAIDTDGDQQISTDEVKTFTEQLAAQVASAGQDATTGADFATLVKQAYEEVATGVSSKSSMGSTLSATA